MEDKVNVTLLISLPKHWPDEQTATIKGPEEGVNMAANEAVNIVEQCNEYQEQKKMQRNQRHPVRIRRAGHCKHDSNWDFPRRKHDEWSRNRSPSMHRPDTKTYSETARITIPKLTRSRSTIDMENRIQSASQVSTNQ